MQYNTELSQYRILHRIILILFCTQLVLGAHAVLYFCINPLLMKLIPQILILMMTLSCSEDIPAGNITLSPEENITPSPEEGADPSPEEDEDVQPEITVEEPDFGEEVKVLPPAGASMVYSPSLITRNYRPVSTKYIKTWSASPSWIDAKARIVPYLEGFEDYQMSRKEYVLSTNRYGSSTTLPRQEATGRF